MANDTKENKPNFHFIASSPDALIEGNDQRRFRALIPSELISGNEKCQGIGCAFKQSCGRFTRPDAIEQQWAAYYALTDDDCQYFEPMITQGAENADA